MCSALSITMLDFTSTCISAELNRALPVLRASNKVRSNLRFSLNSAILRRSASDVMSPPVKASISSMKSASSSTASGVHASPSDVSSCPKYSGLPGDSKRSTSTAPSSWMQWSARKKPS